MWNSWPVDWVGARLGRAVRCLGFAVLLVWGAPAGATIVSDIRVADHDGRTRVVIEIDNAVSFSVFTLADPYRVVIDLPEVGWRLPAEPLPQNVGLMERLRYGLFKRGNSRLVLDVGGAVRVARAFRLAPGETPQHRLVIDLTATGRQAFLAGVSKPALVVAADSEGQNDAPAPPTAKPSPPVSAPALTAKAASAALPSSPFGQPPRKPDAGGRAKAKVRTIVLDPGHGGVDPGAIGPSGVYEKYITLAMAKEMRRQLNATGRYKAVLTRDRDIFIRLRDRVQIARDAGADLFVSIHADTIPNRSISGPSIYTLSEKASDKEAADLAEKENKADLIAGVDLTNESPDVTTILIDLAQRESMNRSAHFASGLIKEIGRETKLLRNTHRFAGFAVLKAPDVPSVLLELGFLSNKKDEKSLNSKGYRVKVAAAIVRAADAYFSRVEEAKR